MKRVPWSIYRKDRCVGVGSVLANDEREALGRVLAGEHDVKLQPDEHYGIHVGSLTTSSFGDEFERTAGATSWAAEPALEHDHKYIFAPPPKKDPRNKPAPDAPRPYATGGIVNRGLKEIARELDVPREFITPRVMPSHARKAMDRYVREVDMRRAKEAAAHGCPLDDIDVEFVPGGVRFTYNPKPRP